MRKVKRQIHFYDIKLQKLDKEKGLVNSKNYKEDLKDIFNKIDIFPFDKLNLDYSKYLRKQNGTYDFIEIAEITDNVIKGKLINIDYSGLTHYEEQGKVRSLKEKLPKTASVAQISHFIIYFDSNIMAFEYNAKSSHAPSLANYIKEKLKMEYNIEFKNLLNRNKQRLFNSIKKVKSFDFSASSRLLLANNAAKGGFFKAAEATLALANNETDVEQIVTIKMKPKRITKKNKTPYYDAEKIKESINNINLPIDNPEDYFKLDIVGFNELNERIAVNYTNDFITSGIVLESDKIESSDFFEKIDDSYKKIYTKYVK